MHELRAPDTNKQQGNAPRRKIMCFSRVRANLLLAVTLCINQFVEILEHSFATPCKMIDER